MAVYSTFRKSERRREDRDPLSVPLSILCTDQEGRETMMHARLIDISIKGARMSVLQKIPAYTSVTFYYDKLRVGGRGTVRFCRTSKNGYEVGLQFPNGTGWSPALREKMDLLNLASAISQAEAGYGEDISKPPASTTPSDA